MHSVIDWKLAQRPNYKTNNDKEYPYSEVPYLGEYNLIQIPASLNNLIQHVDYWGEGKIVTQHGISGFSNCYNINHQYQLVSNGLDRNKKIPNRIPVLNYTNCDTSSYIKGNSVITVTVMGAPINSSCAKDIARMVNNDLGQVIVYGFESNSRDILDLTTELKSKALFYYPSHTLPCNLDGLTLFDSHMAFLNLSMLKDELYNNVITGSYDTAVSLTKTLNNEGLFDVISEVIAKFINTSTNNVMTYAYKLWHSEAKDIVNKYLPKAFRLIFNENQVTLVNKLYHLALKLDINTDYYKDRLAWGDSSDKTSKRVSWKIIPVLDNRNVTFKLYNIDYDMFLKLDVNTDFYGFSVSYYRRQKSLGFNKQ